MAWVPLVFAFIVFEVVGVLGLAVLTLRRGGVTLAFPFCTDAVGFSS